MKLPPAGTGPKPQKEVAVELGLLTAEQLDQWVRPEK